MEPEANVDLMYQGQGSGMVANRLISSGMDVSVLRPWIGSDGRTYLTVNTPEGPKAIPTVNEGTLRKDEWIRLDEAVRQAAKPRLRLVSDLLGRGLRYDIPNGMATTVLQSQAQSDITEAEVSMDGLRESKGDRPVWDLRSLPLPIIHKDFTFSAREVAASRNVGAPIDTTSAELAARRVAETAEQMLAGTYREYSFGGGTIYGYTNFPQRITVDLSDWVEALSESSDTPDIDGELILSEILQMKAASQDNFHYGPWVLYIGSAVSILLEEDFKTASDKSIRQRLLEIEGLEDIRTADYLNPTDVVLVEMTSDTVREVVGMDIRTVQWDAQGGMRLHFKVMAIMVPQIRADFYGRCGIVHGVMPT